MFASSFTLESPAFADGGTIPARHTCAGADHSPPLLWHEPPPGTRAFALLVHDPDVPDPAHAVRQWVHWVCWNLPSTTRAIAEGASRVAMPEESREGRHDGGGVGWMGPCPPIGRHRYVFRLHALDAPLEGLDSEATMADVERAMDGRILGVAQLVGYFGVLDRHAAARDRPATGVSGGSGRPR